MPEHGNGKRKALDLNSELGVTRRDLLRRSAIVGGTLLWVAPAIQSISAPALAQAQRESPITCGCCACTVNIVGSLRCAVDHATASECEAICTGAGGAVVEHCVSTAPDGECRCRSGPHCECD